MVLSQQSTRLLKRCRARRLTKPSRSPRLESDDQVDTGVRLPPHVPIANQSQSQRGNLHPCVYSKPSFLCVLQGMSIGTEASSVSTYAVLSYQDTRCFEPSRFGLKSIDISDRHLAKLKITVSFDGHLYTLL
jgi:hypothetical protein